MDRAHSGTDNDTPTDQTSETSFMGRGGTPSSSSSSTAGTSFATSSDGIMAAVITTNQPAAILGPTVSGFGSTADGGLTARGAPPGVPAAQSERPAAAAPSALFSDDKHEHTDESEGAQPSSQLRGRNMVAAAAHARASRSNPPEPYTGQRRTRYIARVKKRARSLVSFYSCALSC